MSESRLDRAVRLYHEGLSWKDIAEHIGVSRQAVEQMRDRHLKAFGERQWAKSVPAAHTFQTTPQTLKRWVAAGAVRISPSGLVWLPDIAQTIRELQERRCDYPECDEAIGVANIHFRFCAEHSQEVKRYRYPVMDVEERARAYQAQQRWNARNPERYREIQARAMRAYRGRQRAKSGAA